MRAFSIFAIMAVAAQAVKVTAETTDEDPLKEFVERTHVDLVPLRDECALAVVASYVGLMSFDDVYGALFEIVVGDADKAAHLRATLTDIIGDKDGEFSGPGAGAGGADVANWVAEQFMPLYMPPEDDEDTFELLKD